jgi:Bacterial Ig-like domain
VARPAAGAGRQAAVAGLLLATLAAACANQGEPPGGPPHTKPPVIVRTVPESGTIVPDLKGDAVIEFDEVIEEMPSSAGPQGAISGLAAKVVLSPVAGEVKVSWHRHAIHVKPAEGWRPNRAYHLELLPGIVDLRHNATKQGTLIPFSTGAPLPSAILSGTALAWVEQRAVPQAVIRAEPLPDTAAYVTIADSVGDFRLTDIPAGRYRVWAIQDQNNNRRADRREAFDTVSVTLDSSASAVLWTFVHDSVGPRLRGVEPLDSTAFRLVFTQALDPRQPLDTARVRLFALPDTTPLRVTALLGAARYDSLAARARAVADSLRRAHDTTQARRDTLRARAAPPPAGARAPVAGGGARPPRRDTTAARVDTTRTHRLLQQRPVPSERLVVQTAVALTPGAKYLVRVRGATNLNGATADAQGVLVVPVPPKPAVRDTTKAKAKPKPP